MNVAITRAKALVIVVGNAVTLSNTHHWKSFIDFCKENKNFYTHDEPLLSEIEIAEKNDNKYYLFPNE